MQQVFYIRLILPVHKSTKVINFLCDGGEKVLVNECKDIVSTHTS